MVDVLEDAVSQTEALVKVISAASKEKTKVAALEALPLSWDLDLNG